MNGVTRFLVGIRWAIALIPVNYAIASALPLLFSEDLSERIFLGGRVLVTLLVGWLVIWHSIGGLWKAALAGVFLNFIDHVVLKGGYYLGVQLFSPESLPFSALQSLWGVLISYVMFLWVPAGVAMVGALAARLYRRQWPPNSPLQADRPQAAGR